MFFDSHCHLTDERLAPDLAGVIARSHAAQVTHFLNIADDLASAHLAQQQARASQAQDVQMWSTAGVHPIQALQWRGAVSETELRALLSAPEVIAVGEIGLDFHYDDSHPQYPGATRSVQEEVLRAQLQVAQALDLPVVLHNREADERLLRVVGEFPQLRGVFHCWASSVEAAERALEMGYYLGFTGMVTFKNAEMVRDVARLCPLDRLLIETDSPYLAPIPHRGKTNEPAYVALVGESIARLKGLAVAEAAMLTTQNAQRLFNLALQDIP